MPLTRREFNVSLSAGLLSASGAQGDSPAPWNEPANIRKAYLAVRKPTWPYPAVDVQKEMAGIEATLADLARKHARDVRFAQPDLIRSVEDAQAFAQSAKEADAVLLVDLTSGTSGMLQALGVIERPVLLYSRPYSGWSYMDVTRWTQEGKKADLLLTSDPEELVPYLHMFRSIHHLRHSKVLVVAPWGRTHEADAFTTAFGTRIEYPSYKDLADAYQSVPVDEARKAGEDFRRSALRVVEPSAADITDALRFYIAVSKFLRQNGANAITIDCLGGFRRSDLPAYPCAAWSKLNDQGLYGVCEGDLESTMTQMLLTAFSGKPGFVSDPVFDTARNEIIHAHCVAATAMSGFSGPKYPFAIRSHMEDNKGVSLQVMMPVGGKITVGKFLDAGKFAVSTGDVIENVDYERGCRTKIRTKVADARKMLEGYTGGLHRVVYYGDYVTPIERMGRLMGFRVMREC